MIYKINHWQLLNQSLFDGTEILQLHGQLDNGKWILTPEIVVFDAANLLVTTKDKKTYKLGDVWNNDDKKRICEFSN
jgi:hypothetical protein